MLFVLSGILAMIGGILFTLICYKFVKLLSVEYEEELEAQRQRFRTKLRIRRSYAYNQTQDEWVEEGVFTVKPYQPSELDLH